MTLRFSVATCNALADAATALANAGAGAGKVRVYSGPQPASADDAPTGTLLLEFTLNDPAWGAAVAGISLLDVVPAISATGLADGTAGWFRMLDSNNATIMDGAAATSGAEINLSTTAITTELEVTITSGTYVQPAA